MNAHASTASAGSNRIPDDREVLFKHHMAKLGSLADERAELNERWKTARRLAKADGFDLGNEIDFGLKIRAAEDDETVASGLRKRLQTAAYLGLPVNFQMDLFGARPDDAKERAFADGLDAGIEGANPQAPDQYSSGDLATAWMDGWHKGQERLREAMQRRMEAANAESEAKQSSEPKKRGRPPGSKNRKKDETTAENTSGTGADPFATKH
ncbi:MAG: hypothetical protein KIS96_03670 [Bauldia sp.]|nr:hypothetical protein [Bauldia sp.]